MMGGVRVVFCIALALDTGTEHCDVDICEVQMLEDRRYLGLRIIIGWMLSTVR